MPEQFEMIVDEVWRIAGRSGPIVTGTIRSGVIRVGDSVILGDQAGITTATVVGIEFHVRPDEGGLVLSDIEGDLRRGQVVRLIQPTE